MSRLLLLAVFIISMNEFAYGQYEELRFPQRPAEIKKLKSLRIATEKKMTEDSGNKVIRSLRMFDTNGMITYERSRYNRRTYTYDAQLRLTTFIDSALGGDEYFRRDYEFEYTGNKLNFSRTAEYNSTYQWDAGIRRLSESSLVGFDEYRRRFFFYDSKNKLMREEFLKPDGRREQTRKISYDFDGNIAAEFQMKYFETGAYDSIHTRNTYDEKSKRLIISKSITWSYSAPDTLPPNVGKSKMEIDSTTYIYSYDAAGNKTKEDFRYSTPGYNHKYEWKYSPEGLMTEEYYYNDKGVMTNKYWYEYTYFKPKKKKKW